MYLVILETTSAEGFDYPCVTEWQAESPTDAANKALAINPVKSDSRINGIKVWNGSVSHYEVRRKCNPEWEIVEPTYAYFNEMIGHR